MTKTAANGPRRKLIVVGNGMVGHHFLEQWVMKNKAGDWDISVFGAERHRAYDRVHLSEYFATSDAAQLMLGDEHFYESHAIDLRLGEQVLGIDRGNRQLHTPMGTYAWDKLVLATGSYPFVPPVPGLDRPGCFVYRTLDDLDAIKAGAAEAKRGVVIGGGLLGLEAANALKMLGVDVHVVEFAPRLMPVQLDENAGELLRKHVEALGVSIHTGVATENIETGEQHAMRMCFAGGDTLETDLIVVSAGVRPQDTLGRDGGLELGERGGILVNDFCQTSDPDIYAIGECAIWEGRHFGLVAPGYKMARTVVGHLGDDDTSQAFKGADMSTKLKLLGVDVGAIGDAQGTTPGSQSWQYFDERAGVYRRLVTDESGRKLLGAILVGDNGPYDTLHQYLLNDIELPMEPQALILPQQSDVELPSVELPLTATVCSCHNVTRGDICEAINDGAVNIAALKETTRAATGCGGCAATLKSVLEGELERRGVKVDRSLCEHFSHTRQELFHLVRVEGIRTFDDLLKRHGKGGGCDICKPAVASMLASYWNDHIHQPAHLPLQDTNDTFMANMQRNGTYSVVPRVPGGEITPDMLLAIGAVAKKYELYTKITGGQRIDLFGATLDELPLIWEELIEAGFETGHAYGKALRTVKSCVGSTWCRFGVQDSVGMAIALEHRYKGLRAPHKIKMAVSGCTRECAEAQGKDIGVIATDRGWNLYVAGNGGARPRHADLFATDLDDEALVRYIDRILMFYVYTADRLQRTSTWMENLEGGLEYLREVVIHDSLGICAELEARMKHVRETYVCEWKQALNDPEKRRRFKGYINSRAPLRERIPMMEERGQLVPRRKEETA